MKESVQEAAKQYVDAIDCINQYEAFEAGANWQKKQYNKQWQLCPKCNGNGQIQNPYPGITSTINVNCDVCNGAKILATPD